MLVRNAIAALLANAVEAAQRLDLLPTASLPEVLIERPQKAEHGDFATSLPLRLARAAGLSPMEIAWRLAGLIEGSVGERGVVLDRAWAAPPGFVNMTLRNDWVQRQVEAINGAGNRYGNVDVGGGRRVQVEFVSVNPTGPVHVGHARGAVLGSTLATVLGAAGFEVTREYYVNDAGTQMDLFYRSLYARYVQAGGEELALPDGGYQGRYLAELGRQLAHEYGSRFMEGSLGQGMEELGAIGLERMLESIRGQLARLGVEFDVWFRERSLFASGEVDSALDLLRDSGYIVEREGALWFTSSLLGDDKDSVVVRSSGQPTYFASDIAYHRNKLALRGFDRVVDVWGADHQGHVRRMEAVVRALAIDPERLAIIIAQLVTLKRGGEMVRASKRTGDLVTLEELLDEVGSDACRYFFLARSAESQMDFDLELAVRQSADNPVYYVQYGHARITSILRLAKERHLHWADGDVSLLTHEAELSLVKRMVQLPELVDTVARTLEPHHLPHYAVELATAFHSFYDTCRVISSGPMDMELTKARLKLCQAARTVLARALSLMGMDAPDSM